MTPRTAAYAQSLAGMTVLRRALLECGDELLDELVDLGDRQTSRAVDGCVEQCVDSLRACAERLEDLVIEHGRSGGAG